VPKWLPFAGAAVGAVVLFQFWAALFGAVISAFDNPAQWPGLTMHWVPGLWMNVPPMVLLCFLVSFAYMYALDARRRADALRAVQLDGARLGRRSYESRLQAMQARVEPEFLFETLGQVEQLYENAPAVAERVLDDLIVYLRGVLPSLETSDSTVSIELEIARAWLDIMKARAGGRLSVSIHKRFDAGAGRMPPMVLLPLIEHAAKPATRLPAAVQVLAIEASREGGRLRVVVTDSADTFATAAEADAVADVRSRLHALYGAAATLSFDHVPSGGAQAIVELPYERDT
jgi:LytS/YehU family sensor histidine kinase